MVVLLWRFQVVDELSCILCHVSVRKCGFSGTKSLQQVCRLQCWQLRGVCSRYNNI